MRLEVDGESRVKCCSIVVGECGWVGIRGEGEEWRGGGSVRGGEGGEEGERTPPERGERGRGGEREGFG